MIILDTNVVSELLRPRPDRRVVTWLDAQHGSQVFLTSISEAELRYGVAVMDPGKRRDILESAINTILEQEFRDHILSFDSPAAEIYAVIGAARRAAGRPIGVLDAQIAAIAKSKDAAVATRNVRDFEDCGVEIVNPWTDGG